MEVDTRSHGPCRNYISKTSDTLGDFVCCSKVDRQRSLTIFTGVDTIGDCLQYSNNDSKF